MRYATERNVLTATPLQPVIIVHGGAGRFCAERLAVCRDGCRDAALAGWQVLQAGGSALDAVVRAVQALEDNPAFNAGTGAVLNAEGEVQLDASLMDGATLRAGAVAAVQRIRNPIALARTILDDGRHVLLVGAGAERFARQAGIPRCAPADLVVERQRRRWEQQHGTVGCVALDGGGRIAAGTSTGGRFDALPGRVGDSALIGCGTYASAAGGVSCTGLGEAIIRTVLAKTAVDLLAAGRDPLGAAGQALALLEAHLEAEAGLIVLDGRGRTGYARNSEAMPVCVVSGSGAVRSDD